MLKNGLDKHLLDVADLASMRVNELDDLLRSLSALILGSALLERVVQLCEVLFTFPLNFTPSQKS